MNRTKRNPLKSTPTCQNRCFCQGGLASFWPPKWPLTCPPPRTSFRHGEVPRQKKQMCRLKDLEQHSFFPLLHTSVVVYTAVHVPVHAELQKPSSLQAQKVLQLNCSDSNSKHTITRFLQTGPDDHAALLVACKSEDIRVCRAHHSRSHPPTA